MFYFMAPLTQRQGAKVEKRKKSEDGRRRKTDRRKRERKNERKYSVRENIRMLL
jgi:hypothetical protein